MKFYLYEYAGKSDIFCTYTNDDWFAKFFVADDSAYIKIVIEILLMSLLRKNKNKS